MKIERDILISTSRLSTEPYLADSLGEANIGEKKADSNINIPKTQIFQRIWKGGHYYLRMGLTNMSQVGNVTFLFLWLDVKGCGFNCAKIGI